MSLQISQKNGTFYLNGKINTSTCRAFIIHFEYNIEQQNHVAINIDAVNEIDRDGLIAIKTLKAIALRNCKMFTLIGKGCKEIYDDFNHTSVA